MPEYRCNRIPGGTYFFTLNLLDRRARLLVEHIDVLRDAVRTIRVRRPFHIDAWVVMPDHMHAVWTLPAGDSDYSGRWNAIKVAFSKMIPADQGVTGLRTSKGERGIWQRRFWEHTIRDDADFRAHVDYVHINPFKHGLVERVQDWPYSSFHRHVARGVYAPDWGGDFESDLAAGERRD